MAQNKWFYLDKAGLSQYDALIKQYINTEDQKAIKYITFVPATDPKVGTNPTTIYFWKGTPTQTPDVDADYKVVLPDSTNFLQKAASATFTSGQWAVFDANGKIIGVTPNATNVAFDDTTAQTGSNTVQGAIESIAQATGGGVASKTVYITETAGGASDLYSKRYGVYQGGEGSSSDPVPAEKLADIDIPKDMVVEDGSVVDIVFKASDNTLHEGSETGPDVTEAIKGPSGTATSADAGKYVKLVIANTTSTAIYIKATDLVDIYTGGTTTSGIVDVTNNVISFNLDATLLGKINSAVQETVIAQAFSESATYALGDYVMYQGKLYECTTAVTTPGAWNPASWYESKVMQSYQPIPSSYIQGLFT